MSETKTTAAVSPALVVREPLAVQDPKAIRPVRPTFVSDEKDQEIQAGARALAAEILRNPTDVTITTQLYELGAKQMRDNTRHVGLMETRMAAVLKEVETGNPVVRNLQEIKAQLDLVNPAVVGQTEGTFVEKVFFGLIRRTASRVPRGAEILLLINERRDTVAGTIDTLKRHLWQGRDESLRNAAQLGQIANNLFETQEELQIAAYTGQLLWEELAAALAVESDPVRRQALQNLVNDLAVQVVDIQTVDTLNVQSRMAAETLINNVRQIVQGVRRVSDVLLPAVATNLAVKAAAQQQLQVIEAMRDITRAAETTIIDTAEDTRKAAVQMQRMQSEGMINPEALQRACDEYIQMTAELEQIRFETEQNARLTSQVLTKLATTMREHADPATRARQARENIN